jgi:hypothetical protein
MTLAVSALVFGAVLGTRFHVAALGIAVGTACIAMVAAEIPLIEIASVWAGLQVGYLAGTAIRAASGLPRKSRSFTLVSRQF